MASAPAVCSGTIDADWPGCSGTGFCDGDNAAGAYAQFTVSAAGAGTATIAVRFAHGTTTGPARGSHRHNLDEGSNIIRFNPTGAGGLPNLDCVELAPG
ncbi:hypothetical protein GCM10027168_47330 [Streptomyces capparidis]